MLDVTKTTLAQMVKERSDIYFAVGSGNETWDDFSPPLFDNARKTLYNETYRAKVTSVTYVDPATYLDSATPTNCLKFTFSIPATSSIDNTRIREKGIFIGSSAKNGGALLHAETQAMDTKVTNKSFDVTMIFTIRQGG
jgi:hypothetical protein